MSSTAQALDPSVAANPWAADPSQSPAAGMGDPIHAQAIAGFKKGVTMGAIEPNDGLARLKKIGAVPDTTQVEDLLPGYSKKSSAAPAQQMGPPAPGGNPWDTPATPGDVDPTHALALKGFQKAVTTGQMSPQEGVQRLQKLGVPAAHIAAVAGPMAFPQHDPNNGALNAILGGGALGAGMKQEKVGNTQTQTNTGKQMSSDEQNASQITTDSDSTTEGQKRIVTSTGKKFDPSNYQLQMAAAQGYPIQDLGPNDPKDPASPHNYEIGKVADPSSPFQRQQQGIDRMQDLLKIGAQSKADSPISMGVNLSPLNKLADFENAKAGVKTNNDQGYVAPETYEQLRNKTLGNQQVIQKDNADLQKSVYENMRVANPTMTYQDMLQNTLANTNANVQKDATGSKNTTGSQTGQVNTNQDVKATTTGVNPAQLLALARMGQSQERMNQTAGIQAQRMVNTNPILNTYQQRVDGANKILNLMNAADDGKVASTQAMLGQLNAEIARLETGSQSPGLGSSEKTEMQSYGAQLSAIADRFTGAQSPVDLHNAFAQARGMVSDLRDSYTKAQASQMQRLKAGALPNQQSTFGAKSGALNSTNAAAPASVTRVGKDGNVYKKGPDGMWHPVSP